MFTTGNKFLIGATTAATVGAVLYGVTQGGTLGSIGLVFAAIALAMITGANLYFRDANVSAMDSPQQHATTAAAQGAPGRTPWPLLWAFGAVTVVVGLVSQQTFFVIGTIILLAAGAEWMIEAWALRSSADRSHAAEVRNRMANSLEFPLAGAIGVGALVFAFSRMMLWTSKVGAVVLFSVVGAIILAFAAVVTAGGRKVPKSAVGAAVGVAAIAVVTGGAAAGLDGQRDIHVFETVELLAAEGKNICDSPEPGEPDKKASQTVSLRANQAARVTLTEAGELVFNVPGPIESGGTALQIWRSNPTNIIFRNETSEERRFTLDLGMTTIEVHAEDGHGDEMAEPEEIEVRNLICTSLLEEGGEQVLSVTIGQSSLTTEDGYRIYVPGFEGPELEVVVP